MGTECQLSMDFSAEQEYKSFFEAVDKLNKFLKYQGKESVIEVKENKAVEFKEEEEVCPECGENPCICDNTEEEACGEKKKKCSTEEEFADKEEEACGEKKKKCSEDDIEDDVEDDKEEEACKKKKCSVEDNEEFADKEEEACGEKKKKCSEDDIEDDVEDDKEEEACGGKKKKCSTEENEENEEKEDFSLSLNNIFKSLRTYLEPYTYTYTSFWGDEFECTKYYVEDLIPEDNKVILYDSEVGEYFGTDYAVDKDTVSCDLNNLTVYMREWRAKEEGASRFEVEEETKREAIIYNMIAEEYHELRNFKLEVLAKEEKEEFDAKVNEILSQFDFAKEETQELVEKVYAKDLSLEMFENMLFALEGRKARARKENFAKLNNNSNGLGVCDVEDKKEEPKCKYQDILEQYGKKRK